MVPPNHGPVHWPPVAVSSAPIRRLPSHPCVPSLLTVPPGVCTAVRGTSVSLAPSTRKVTLAASALGASARTMSRPATSGPVIRIWATRATPFHEGVRLDVGAGLLAPGLVVRAFPWPVWAAVAATLRVACGRVLPVTVAGPRRIHTGFP